VHRKGEGTAEALFKCSNFRNQFKAFEEWQTSMSVVGKEEQAKPTSTSTSTSSAAKPVTVMAAAEVRQKRGDIVMI
jgi:hypothetical protein